ncbi:MAG: prephenate dehydrogenase/arogenate dehydrogenase family protein [Elusimicrobiota bacterium]|nr:prephenate dehydrogenase/arogenate dehydrogenase family protein [Elusimicrobiota bacterium]
MNIAIIGFGLIGGSLGKALKVKPQKYHITAIVRKKSAALLALKTKSADTASLNLQDVSKADIVVIATPVDLIIPIYKELIPIVKKGAVITDAGSVKYPIEQEIRKLSRRKGFISFVGSHPMSGKETNGLLNAQADLFKNANVVITDSIQKSKKNENAIANMWRDSGANIIRMSAQKHDELVALTSHLPHLMAFALNKIYKDKRSKDKKIEKIVAGSFYSAIRVASSSADMWAPIFKKNIKYIKSNLNAFIKELKKFEKNLNNQAKVKERILETQK